jgi:MoaE-MoaD fusion protein
MRVRILYFGVLKELAGSSETSMDLDEGATVSDLVRLIEEKAPRMAAYRRSLAVSVNREYALPEKRLHEGDEIGLLPPVSGGTEVASEERRNTRAFLVREKIESEKVVAGIKTGPDGAVVVFDGIVRDNTRGRKTVYLDYEAYEDMAVKQLDVIAERAMRDFEIRDAVIFHRLGRLYIGETSVLIAVASAHRAAAFDACRWMIDTLKKTVPIWKKEYFEDGAMWAAGEPFPAEIGAQK